VLARAVAAMRARMETEVSGEVEGRRNPKTGFGGLVDVEFAVQYLQLVHGAAHSEVLVPGTPEAIARLREAGALPAVDAERLADAYTFLRRLELRLRIVHDHGMSHLPRGSHLATLARRLGYAGPQAGEELSADYARITEAVRELFRRIVGTP
jgi:glutamate-ammonia-ligase adenylyltransferase